MTLTASKTPSPRWNVTSQMLHLREAAGVGTPLRDAKVLLCLLRLRSVRSVRSAILLCLLFDAPVLRGFRVTPLNLSLASSIPSTMRAPVRRYVARSPAVVIDLASIAGEHHSRAELQAQPLAAARTKALVLSLAVTR